MQINGVEALASRMRIKDTARHLGRTSASRCGTMSIRLVPFVCRCVGLMLRPPRRSRRYLRRLRVSSAPPIGGIVRVQPAGARPDAGTIALYPDPLLSQILMAATYPLEIVEAARWSTAIQACRR